MGKREQRYDFAELPDIGGALKALREDLDLSQVKVMELTGINNKTLSGYENGVSEPDLRTLATLTRLYGACADCILNPKCELVSVTREERRMLARFRLLTPDQKKSVAARIGECIILNS